MFKKSTGRPVLAFPHVHFTPLRDGDPSHTGLSVLDNWVFGLGWIRWVSLLLPATSESNSSIQVSWKEIVGGGRGDTYTYLYMISTDSITTTFEIQ